MAKRSARETELEEVLALTLTRVEELQDELELAIKHKLRYHEVLEDLSVYVACMGCSEVWHECALGGWREPARCKRCDELWCLDCKPRGCDCADGESESESD